MGLRHRSLLSAATVALSLALIGCDTADTLDKLSDMIPFSESKKPLPGERKEVFPQGVPGVPQGVPPDLVKGNQPPPDATPPQQQAAAPPPAEKPKPKKKVQAKPKAPPQAAPDQSAQTVPPTQQMQSPQPSSAWPPPMQPASGWPSQTPPAAPKQ
ncbi:MAG: hypothetical protein JO328_15895 [Hyphomicrobiales bacterium]|nr:hypothetical protein [Hyphomicrobiales bacterium]MBV9428315.1 hypothetical protein [Bradyrhizobiaceae bacterium]